MPELIGNDDEQDVQRRSPSMISPSSVLVTERSSGDSHEGQTRYGIKLCFKRGQYNGLITLAAIVSRIHREAALVFGGVQEVTDQRTRRIRIAQWLALERVDPCIEPGLVRTAPQVGEILEQH